MRSIKVELLMDSGALFTAIPLALHEGLGLRPVARRKLRAFGDIKTSRFLHIYLT